MTAYSFVNDHRISPTSILQPFAENFKCTYGSHDPVLVLKTVCFPLFILGFYVCFSFPLFFNFGFRLWIIIWVSSHVARKGSSKCRIWHLSPFLRTWRLYSRRFFCVLTQAFRFHNRRPLTSPPFHTIEHIKAFFKNHILTFHIIMW